MDKEEMGGDDIMLPRKRMLEEASGGALADNIQRYTKNTRNETSQGAAP